MKGLIILFLLTLVALAGCGPQPEEPASQSQTDLSAVQTPYGSAAEAKKYHDDITPLIQTGNALHMNVYAAVGSSNTATGQNLARAITEIQVTSQMQSLIDELNQIQVPPLLAPLHRDIGKMMHLRIEWYDLILKGWQLEQEKQDDSLYAQAEVKLRELNALGEKLNVDLHEIYQALEQVIPPEQRTASP